MVPTHLDKFILDFENVGELDKHPKHIATHPAMSSHQLTRSYASLTGGY
jgi:hypothetical protein